MSSDPYQEKLKRVRPPRVRIDYTVETEGAEPVLELPFVVGILADLGTPSDAKLPVRQRTFAGIDRDNFNQVMEKAAPRVAFRVPNRLGDNPDEQLNVELTFQNLGDFGPGQVARKVPALRQLLELRDKLTELEGKLEGNDKLEKLLNEVIAEHDKKGGGQ